jgi:hypothetical protein
MLAFALSMLGVGKTLVQGIVQWLSRRSLAEIGCIILCIICGVLLIAHKADQRHIAKVEKQLHACTKGREADRAAYRQAQQEASVQNQKQVATVTAEHDRINHAQVSTLNQRLQLIADELRRERAAQGAAGGPATGPDVAAPCRAADPAWMCLSPEERLSAAQNEERHDELIDLVLKHSAVDPNKP